MDFLTSIPPEALAALAGVVQLFINYIVRRTGIGSRVVVLGTTGLVAVAATAYFRYVPEAAQTEVASFASIAFAVQWTLYEVFGLKKYLAV